jgi:hypothetical protein
MRSALMIAPPAFWVISIIEPSTKSGTPASMNFGGVPMRSGQFLRTRSWLPPMPPDVTITACAENEKSPATVRELGSALPVGEASSTSPDTPSHTPLVTLTFVTLWRNLSVTSPFATASRTRRSNGSTTPGPVPHVTWKRGTELPCPSAR